MVLVRAPIAASSGNGEASWRAKWCTRTYAPSTPTSSAATASSMLCSSASAPVRTCDPGTACQWPKERKPILVRHVHTNVSERRAIPGRQNTAHLTHGPSALLPPRGRVVLAHAVLPAGRADDHAAARADDGAPDQGPRATERAAAAVAGAAFGRREVRARAGRHPHVLPRAGTTADGDRRAAAHHRQQLRPRHPSGLDREPDGASGCRGHRCTACASPCTPTPIADDEREAVWRTLEENWPGYRGYERTSGRVLRIFRLMPAVTADELAAATACCAENEERHDDAAAAGFLRGRRALAVARDHAPSSPREWEQPGRPPRARRRDLHADPPATCRRPPCTGAPGSWPGTDPRRGSGRSASSSTSCWPPTVLVVGVPLYNYSMPSTLKAWVDHVHVPGLTAGLPELPLRGRHAVLVSSRGGRYGDGAAPDAWDHATSASKWCSASRWA